MKKFFLYLLIFILIIFLIPALLTKKTKSVSVSEQPTVEERSNPTTTDKVLRRRL
ncbi:MAG: hypothetical protein IKF38_00875 [Clostridia bacterium]|nr:hypothetical protein [Clostridia bacterium]